MRGLLLSRLLFKRLLIKSSIFKIFESVLYEMVVMVAISSNLDWCQTRGVSKDFMFEIRIFTVFTYNGT